MIYGAYGFTGELAARRAKEGGLRPVLAGRSEERTEAIARELSLEHRTFSLDDPNEVDRGIEGMALVLHCAGPYSKTSRPMVDACLDQGAHYLDVTGEYRVIEAVLGRDAEAKRAGVVLMPSVGFDVVPTDCMAVKLKEELPDATLLELAFSGGMKPSPGTAKTTVEGLDAGALVRRDGEIVAMKEPATKKIHFGGRERTTMSIPWGDLVSAYRSTAIPNIRVYTEVPPAVIRGAKMLKYATPLLRLAAVQRFLKKQAGKRALGPSEDERKTARMHVWGRVENSSGQSVEGQIDVPEGYELTVLAALECMARVLRGDAAPGATTPASAFGPDLLTDLPGVDSFELVRRS